MNIRGSAAALDATAARSWEEAARAIVEAHAASNGDGIAVYQRLKRCIADLITAEALLVGAQLPPEQWLARNLGISLGTTQRALSALMADGYIERRQGYGTYVAAPRRPMTELWHFRFLDPNTQTYAAVYSHLISRKVVRDARAAEALGQDSKGFVEIRRAIDVAGEFACYSRMYLGASHFAGLMDIEEAVFDNVNLKQIFAAQFARPTLDVVQHMHLAKPSADANSILQLPRGQLAMVLTATAISHSGAYSLQEIYIPQSRFRLDLSASGRTGAPDWRDRRGSAIA